MVQLTRAILQRLAEEKAADAELLFANRRWSNAYYLFGYAVEIGLKAVAARRFQQDTIPDRRLVNALYTHKLKELAEIAGLADALQAERERDRVFDAHWIAVLGWSEEARYDTNHEDEARALRNAVTSPDHGVMRWLRQYW
ncbi:MAG: hypothetical protein JNM13_12960 [Hyphomicrobiaceae bacterium]|nr:hypothetical protein [Hyphomicrobiaceae bacterium]